MMSDPVAAERRPRVNRKPFEDGPNSYKTGPKALRSVLKPLSKSSSTVLVGMVHHDEDNPAVAALAIESSKSKKKDGEPMLVAFEKTFPPKATVESVRTFDQHCSGPDLPRKRHDECAEYIAKDLAPLGKAPEDRKPLAKTLKSNTEFMQIVYPDLKQYDLTRFLNSRAHVKLGYMGADHIVSTWGGAYMVETVCLGTKHDFVNSPDPAEKSDRLRAYGPVPDQGKIEMFDGFARAAKKGPAALMLPAGYFKEHAPKMGYNPRARCERHYLEQGFRVFRANIDGLDLTVIASQAYGKRIDAAARKFPQHVTQITLTGQKDPAAKSKTEL
jgi:hypothetical protein